MCFGDRWTPLVLRGNRFAAKVRHVNVVENAAADPEAGQPEHDCTGGASAFTDGFEQMD